MNTNEKNTNKEWYVRTEDGRVYGPADIESLVEWAKDGRVDPSAFLSRDRIEWTPAQLMPELEMKWLVELEPGSIIGPFNRAYLVSSTRDGSLASDAKVYRLHEFAVEQDPPPVIVEKEVIKEVPVEKIVEKIVEVEKPPRTTVVVPEVVEPTDETPPRPPAGGIFGGASRSSLAALEAQARRELAAAGRGRFGIFGRKRQ